MSGDEEKPKTTNDIDATVARPTDSRRSAEQICAGLERWLPKVVGEQSGVKIDSFEIPDTNGMSSETGLLTATWNQSGMLVTRELVVRIAPVSSEIPVFMDYDFEMQFQVMKHIREVSRVPVPQVHWLELDPEYVGAPFFMMSRIQGLVPPDVLPYNFGDCWISEATDAQLRLLEEETVKALVALHSIEHPEVEFPLLVSRQPGDSALRQHVNELRAYNDWVFNDGRSSKLIEETFAWLNDHWPEDDSDVVLSWGDARIGNIMYQDFKPVAILDWEMAGLGPREIDIAWMIFLHRFFEDIAQSMDLPGMPTFLHRDRIVALYEQYSGYRVTDLDFYMVYAALRHAVIMSQVQRRAIAFGTAEEPENLDHLFMHHETLRALLDGNYWDRVAPLD